MLTTDILMDQQRTYLCKYYVYVHDHMDHCINLFIPKINIAINLKVYCILLYGVAERRKRQNVTSLEVMCKDVGVCLHLWV